MPSHVELAPRAARAPAHAPNAALTQDAGPLAFAIARVWPRPHTAYFGFEPARRRMAGVIADRAGPEAFRRAEALETWSLKRLATAYLPDAPLGFVEAVRKIGDVA